MWIRSREIAEHIALKKEYQAERSSASRAFDQAVTALNAEYGFKPEDEMVVHLETASIEYVPGIETRRLSQDPAYLARYAALEQTRERKFKEVGKKLYNSARNLNIAEYLLLEYSPGTELTKAAFSEIVDAAQKHPWFMDAIRIRAVLELIETLEQGEKINSFLDPRAGQGLNPEQFRKVGYLEAWLESRIYLHTIAERHCRKFYTVTPFHLRANKEIRTFRKEYRKALRCAVNDLSVKDDSDKRLLEDLRSSRRIGGENSLRR